MKKYAVISNKKRNELISRVAINGESVSRVAKQLRMKLPSAKSILRTYKKLGRVFDKKKVINRGIRPKKPQIPETQAQAISENPAVSQTEEKLKEEVIEKRQYDIKQQSIQTQKQGIFHQSPFKLEQTFNQFVKQQMFSQWMAQQQMNYYCNFLSYMKTQQFSKMLN